MKNFVGQEGANAASQKKKKKKVKQPAAADGAKSEGTFRFFLIFLSISHDLPAHFAHFSKLIILIFNHVSIFIGGAAAPEPAKKKVKKQAAKPKAVPAS